MKKRIGLYPGSFDPVTNGHIDIIIRGSKIVDTLIIGVAENEEKSHLFSMLERKKLIENQLIKKKNNITNVKVLSFKGLLMNFANHINASIIIRGLRAVSDFDYEFQMTGMNYQLNPDLETIFLMSSDKNSFISSNFVKEVHKLGGDVSKFVSTNTIKILDNKNT